MNPKWDIIEMKMKIPTCIGRQLMGKVSPELQKQLDEQLGDPHKDPINLLRMDTTPLAWEKVAKSEREEVSSITVTACPSRNNSPSPSVKDSRAANDEMEKISDSIKQMYLRVHQYEDSSPIEQGEILRKLRWMPVQLFKTKGEMVTLSRNRLLLREGENIKPLILTAPYLNDLKRRHGVCPLSLNQVILFGFDETSLQEAKHRFENHWIHLVDEILNQGQSEIGGGTPKTSKKALRIYRYVNEELSTVLAVEASKRGLMYSLDFQGKSFFLTVGPAGFEKLDTSKAKEFYQEFCRTIESIQHSVRERVVKNHYRLAIEAEVREKIKELRQWDPTLSVDVNYHNDKERLALHIYAKSKDVVEKLKEEFEEITAFKTIELQNEFQSIEFWKLQNIVREYVKSKRNFNGAYLDRDRLTLVGLCKVTDSIIKDLRDRCQNLVLCY
eukprot:TRINITY_DN11133_c0_g4_i1.p1 TRINITY_DN11133_c0_g4~~TRINITY_DN11133_c0_g4_i1.p1  ORF type:complete len:442 (+),score=63.76 TRINITY_DN11133_c0_g4_i1:197-1522(+)